MSANPSATVTNSTGSGTGAVQLPPPGSPELVGSIAPVLIDGAKNAGHSWLCLRNTTQADMTVMLMAESLQAAGRELSARLTFALSSEATDAPFTAVVLKAQTSLPVELLVRNYTYAGTAVARLHVGERIHQVSVVLHEVPFKVAPQTAAGEKKLVLIRDERGLIALKNDDPIAYPVTWRLSVAGSGDVAEGKALLPAASQIELVVNPPRSWWRHKLAGMFKDELNAGSFSVQFEAPDVPRLGPSSLAALSATPVRTFPLEFELAYGAGWHLLGDAIIVLALVLGAFLSMVLTLWIPSYVRRSRLRAALVGLSAETRQISQHVDSRLRVGLRVERLRLEEEVNALKVPSLAAPERLSTYETELATLRRRIELACEAAAADARVEQMRSANGGVPPSLLDNAANSLRDAVAVLIKTAPSAPELELAKSAIASAHACLARIGEQDANFAHALAARIAKLRSVYEDPGEFGKTASCGAWKALFGDVFEVLRHRDAATIQPAGYDVIDRNARRLELLQSFIRAENDASDERGQAIARTCKPELIEALRKHDWHSLSRVQCLVSQVEERVTSETVEAELRDGESVRVEYEPRAVHPNEPVRLRVRFDNPEYDDSAARRAFKCRWDFGPKVGEEEGWEITHYFRTPDEARFDVSFLRYDGKPVKSAAGERLQMHKAIPLLEQPKIGISDTTKAELWRMALAMTLAVVTLVSGAREQLMKLDVFFGLLAVVALGFTASVVKDLFAKPPTTS